MIARISGKVVDKGLNYLLVETGGICYQVLLPAAVMQRLEELPDLDAGNVSLITYHYYHVDPSRNIPILIGFLNEVERDFFEVFITVSGIGPRAALKALNQPISLIAKAIDEADTAFLTSLPGIGQQRAREIIAKLQNKVGKFALIQDGQLKAPRAGEAADDIAQEALAVLLQLEYKKSEAQVMIKKAMERISGINSTEELLNEVYRQKKSK
ncbi:MAG: helix-hairpin-helix domain-containing protein [Candidatus Omnitrophica bacterium]|nr:helix-hairpin-helix domain-containing protein [Candidatus Omnitrophota bacterium]